MRSRPPPSSPRPERPSRREPGERRQLPQPREIDERSTNKEEKAKAKNAATTFSMVGFASGGVTMLLGPLIVRVWCETLIILFKIHDALKESNDRRRRHG